MPRKVICAGNCGQLLWTGSTSSQHPICGACRAMIREYTPKMPRINAKPKVKCAWCQVMFMRKTTDRRYEPVCSLECRTNWGNYIKQTNFNPWPLNHALTIFKTTHTSQRKQSAILANLRRKSSISSRPRDFFKRVDIFERDDWTCHICSQEIDPALKHPDQFSAVVDHVIPVSKGGSDTLNNVKAAHQRCNAVKGNRLLQVAI